MSYESWIDKHGERIYEELINSKIDDAVDHWDQIVNKWLKTSYMIGKMDCAEHHAYQTIQMTEVIQQLKQETEMQRFEIERLNNVIRSYKDEVRIQRNEMAQMKNVVDVLLDNDKPPEHNSLS